jgi:hypothetical protein
VLLAALLAVLGILVLAPLGPAVLAAPPVVTRVRPAAARPGEVTEVTLIGEGLAEASGLWSSLPLAAELDREKTKAGAAVFRVAVRGDAPPAVGAVRAVTRSGVSPPVLFLIDDLLTLRPGTHETDGDTNEAGGPHEAGGVLSPHGALEGEVREGQSARHRLALAAGETIAVEVVAARLGSPLDPFLRLLDGEGRELAFVDDSPGLGRDARLSFTALRAGEHVVEVRDALHGEGDGHLYRLRLGGLPLAAPWPGARSGAQAPGEDGARLEAEPNDRLEEGTAVGALPAVLAGCFAEPGDRDLYRLEAAKGERLLVSGRTRSLASPAELHLRLLDARGAVVARADPSGADEGTLDHTVAESGPCFIEVEEIARRGGPDFRYRLEVAPHAGFTLAVETETLNAPPGGEVRIQVACERRGFDGPITLRLAGDGAGLTLSEAVIPQGKKEAVLKAVVPDGLEPGRVLELRVLGAAAAAGAAAAGGAEGAERAERTAAASTLPALLKLFPALRDPPAALDGSIVLGVSAK